MICGYRLVGWKVPMEARFGLVNKIIAMPEEGTTSATPIHKDKEVPPTMHVRKTYEEVKLKVAQHAKQIAKIRAKRDATLNA